MIVHSCIQGTPEWLALRRGYFTASEASAMMGESPYNLTRTELLRQKATGIVPEPTEAEQRLFDDGHAAEAAFRPIAESFIGEDLFPVVGSVEIEGLKLLASFDGLTMDDRIGFEHKLTNQELANAVQNGSVPQAYAWQLEQQLLVSGAEKVLFCVSDGTLENSTRCWYTSIPERRAALIAGWKQFAKDLAVWQPEEAAPPPPTGRAPETLPALRIEVSGHVTASNLSEFKANALAVLSGINRNLQTDADFADAEQTVKWCGDVEERIAAAKRHALSQTASIEEAFRTLDDVSAEVRRVRLDLDKLVKVEKEARRTAIVMEARQALLDHIYGLNESIGKPYMPTIDADFCGVIKGKKNIASMKDAVATELARAKINAHQTANRIEANLHMIGGSGNASLFPDVAALVLKDQDAVQAIVALRLAEADKQRAADLEKERERIAAEERAKAEAAARAEPSTPAGGGSNTGSHGSAVSMTNSFAEAVTVVETPTPTAATPCGTASAVSNETQPAGPPTLRLGQINARLAPISIDTAGLARLGFPHAATDKAAKLYHESSWPAICRAIAAHALDAIEHGARLAA